MGVTFVELTPQSERLIERIMREYTDRGGKLPF
jgi:hypothetical protein